MALILILDQKRTFVFVLFFFLNIIISYVKKKESDMEKLDAMYLIRHIRAKGEAVSTNFLSNQHGG